MLRLRHAFAITLLGACLAAGSGCSKQANGSSGSERREGSDVVKERASLARCDNQDLDEEVSKRGPRHVVVVIFDDSVGTHTAAGKLTFSDARASNLFQSAIKDFELIWAGMEGDEAMSAEDLKNLQQKESGERGQIQPLRSSIVDLQFSSPEATLGAAKALRKLDFVRCANLSPAGGLH